MRRQWRAAGCLAAGEMRMVPSSVRSLASAMRPLPWPRAWLWLCLGLSAIAAPSARADEREFILALQPAFSLVHVGAQTVYGGGGGIDLSYGITDAVAVRATGAFTGHAIDATRSAPSGTMTAWHAGAGITYTIDILRLVPYFDLSIGILGTRRPSSGGASESRNDLGLEVGIGLDYLITRRVAVGVVVRYHALLTALSTIPVWLYAGPRVAIHFGL